MKKKNVLFLVIPALVLIAASFSGCEKKECKCEKPNPQNDLIGTWDCIKFAYIADETISNETVLSKGQIIIPNMEDKWKFVHTNEIFYDHLLSGNLLTLTMSGSTFVVPPQEELDICEALEKTYSFSIKDNDLMIYFTMVQNKNILILKKR